MLRLLFVLGTRGSPLALAQANETRRRLAEALGWAIERIELKIIRTSGDAIQDRPLADSGGKGLFTKEIDVAMLAGEIDGAVHSAKDLPTLIPDGIALAGFLPREDVRDALISAAADTVEGLPPNASLGAASLRRQAQALRLRPDLKVELLRGNVEFPAAQGRDGRDRGHAARDGRSEAARPRPSRPRAARLDAFLPAVGQGAIALTARSDDGRALEALAAIAHAPTFAELAAERAYLAELEGSCRTRSPEPRVLPMGVSCSAARCSGPTGPSISRSRPRAPPPTRPASGRRRVGR